MQELLAQVAEERGVRIMFSKMVVGVDSEKPSVHLKDGDVMDADLIVGADGRSQIIVQIPFLVEPGIRSIIRDAIEGKRVESISPFSAFNVDIPRSLL